MDGLLLRRRQRSRSHRSSSLLMMISKQQLGSFEVLEFMEDKQKSNRKVMLLDYTQHQNDEYIDFEIAWDCQKDIQQQHIQRLQLSEKQEQQQQTSSSFIQGNEYDDNSNEGCDTIIMLQHNPVYTLGTGSDEKFVLGAASSAQTNE